MLHSKTRRLSLVVALGLVQCACATDSPTIAQKSVLATKSFVVYQAWNYRNTPALDDEGIHPIRVVYENELTSPAAGGIWPFTGGRYFDKGKSATVALQTMAHPEEPVALDLESWGHGCDATDRYAHAFRAFKAVNQASQVGMYGFGPVPTWRLYRGLQNGDATAGSSLETSEACYASVYAMMDISLPSLYTWGDDMASWKETAKRSIAMARRLNPGKPVLAFISPQYYATNPTLGLQFIPADVWKKELETLYPIADGVVIWASGKDKQHVAISFDRGMPWFKATEDFIKEHDVK